MASKSFPLLVGLGALFLFSRKARAEPTGGSLTDGDSKKNEGPVPDGITVPREEVDEGEPTAWTEVEGPLPPGNYSAKDGETVVLQVGMDTTGYIGGFSAGRDGDIIEDVYSGLKSGFDLNYQLDGVYITFFQEGIYRLAAFQYEVDPEHPPDWRFVVEGKVEDG